MSRKDRVKITIDLIKTCGFALLTALFGIFAFLVINIQTIVIVQIACCAIGIFCIAIVLYFLLKFLIKNLDELEEL